MSCKHGRPECDCNARLVIKASGETYMKDDPLLTIEERKLITDLGNIYSRFIQLEEHHPMEKEEFANQTHTLQRQIMSRAARRAYPHLFTPMEKTYGM